MSRIGKKPVVIPNGVTAEIAGSQLTVKGPKGTLKLEIHPKVSVTKTDEGLLVDVARKEDKKEKALWGTFRSLVQNMVSGVTDGFKKQLELNGVGFKVALTGRKFTLNLGFSHPVDVELPEGLEATVEKNLITITGFDKQLVGQFAANLRSLKKPEPYKGKGLKYLDEVIIRKAGKVVKAVGK